MVETSYDRYKEDVKKEIEAEERKKKSTFARIQPMHQVLIVGIIVLVAYLYFTSGETCGKDYYIPQKNLCFSCQNSTLDSRTLKCISEVLDNQTCPSGLTINIINNTCEGFPLTSKPQKSFDISKMLIIGVIGLIIFLLIQQKMPQEQRELTNEELFTCLEKEIQRMQNTPFLRQAYQIKQHWIISPTGEFFIPSEYDGMTGYQEKNIKYYPLECIDPIEGKLKKILTAGLDIYTGDMKHLLFGGTDSLLSTTLRSIVKQPSPDMVAEAYKEEWKRKKGLESR